jgi:predicted RND superfamily exporter protein
LNLLTATLPAVILGLGVDFSLHTIYAFHEMSEDEQNTGMADRSEKRVQSLKYVFSKIYKPLLIGAVTTSAAFLSLCIAASRGLRQMGLMGAFGIGCTFLVATTMLPILLSTVPPASLVNIRRLSGRRLSRFTFLAGKGRISAVVLLILIIAGWGAWGVRFSSDQNKLSDQTLPAYVLQNKLQQQGLSLVPIAIVSPDVQTEQAKLAFLQGLDDSPFGLVESDLLAQQEHDDPSRFIGADGLHLILAYPRENAFKPAVFKRIESTANQIRKQFPAAGNWVTGSPFLNTALNRTIKGDLLHCSLFAVIVVFIIVFYCFRSVYRTLMAMLPVGLGTILMVALMRVLNIDFTIMTVVIVPLILGTGIDDGVHMLSRWYVEKRNMLQTLHNVATPIIATSLTSMIGFGSLMISKNPGFRQLGLVVAAGLGFCVLVSLGLLPSVLRTFEGKQVT